MLTTLLVHLLCLVGPLLTGAQAAAAREDDAPNVFARELSDTLKRELAKALVARAGGGSSGTEGESGEPLVKPELHFSTLREAEASGSGIPSPTMFVGGFSFLMMPAPEGSEVYNRVMEMAPTFLNMVPGG